MAHAADERSEGYWFARHSTSIIFLICMLSAVGVYEALTLPVAGLICFLFGFLFGQPALRLSGVYLALATFALATAMPQFLKLGYFEYWTGGVQGLVVTKPDPPEIMQGVL